MTSLGSKKLKVVTITFGDKWSDSISYGLHQEVVEVIPIDVTNIRNYEEVIKILRTHRPDFCFLRNFHFINPAGNLFETYSYLFEQTEFNFVVWYLDSPPFQDSAPLIRVWNQKKKPKQIIFFSIDANDLDFFKSKGISAYHLPMAADARARKFKEHPSFSKYLNQYRSHISYIGSQFFSCETAPRDEYELKDLFCGALIDYLMNHIPQLSRKNTLEITERLFNAQIENGDDFRKVLSTFPNFENLSEEITIFNTSYSWYRLTKMLIKVRDRFSLNVYGSNDWRNFFKDYPKATHRLPEGEMYALFAASKINICFTKYQFVTACHERPLMILMGSGFPLTDYRSDLDLMFKTDEIVTYRSEAELLDKIDFYLNNDSERLRFIEKGHERVIKDHTYGNRMKTLLERVKIDFSL